MIGYDQLDVLAESVRRQVAADFPDPRVPFTEVKAGDQVRHCGQFLTVAIISHQGGWMVLSDADGRTERVESIADDEPWLVGAF